MMNSLNISIKRLEQKDNHTFFIEWNDGQINEYRLNQLQRLCPCAGCVDEQTGKRREGVVISEDVKAHRILSVGRYALRIDFTSGCSAGIYSYQMLRDFLKSSKTPSGL